MPFLARTVVAKHLGLNGDSQTKHKPIRTLHMVEQLLPNVYQPCRVDCMGLNSSRQKSNSHAKPFLTFE